MQSSNPALSDNVFQNFESYGDTTVMTISGTVTKTLIALVLCFLTAGFTFNLYSEAVVNVGLEAAVGKIMPYMLGGLVVGLIASIATMFKQTWAPMTTPVYALAEGFFLGGISAVVQSQFPDVPIAFQALGLTFATAAVMLFAYQTGLIKVTEKLRAGIVAATGAIALLYLVSMGMNFFEMRMPYIHDSGMIGIGFSIFVVGLAAFNLLLDFDLIENLSHQRAPKYMEWYGAFALMVTLVWLYIEILRLLAKLNRRD
ncbi:MAG: Bax inhibitor-1/YccA family protein [Fuerstiella sp.]